MVCSINIVTIYAESIFSPRMLLGFLQHTTCLQYFIESACKFKFFIRKTSTLGFAVKVCFDLFQLFFINLNKSRFFLVHFPMGIKWLAGSRVILVLEQTIGSKNHNTN